MMIDLTGLREDVERQVRALEAELAKVREDNAKLNEALQKSFMHSDGLEWALDAQNGINKELLAELAKVREERDALLWLLHRHGHTKLCPTRISIEFPPFRADACTCGLKTSIESAQKGSK